MRRLGTIAQEILIDGAGILHIDAERALKELKTLLNANDRRCVCKMRGGEYIKIFLENSRSYNNSTPQSKILMQEMNSHFANYKKGEN